MHTSVINLPSILPLDIKTDAPNPLTPWEISPAVFERMKIAQVADNNAHSYRRIILLPTDPEWRLVWRLFHFDKPNRWNIKAIHCVHNRHQTAAFDAHIVRQEKEAEKFPPNWNTEPNAELRKKAHERWKASAELFSPLATIESDGRRYNWEQVKVLPLWHGTKQEVCASICDSGFTFFGKTTLSGKKEGDPKSTDSGFFGSGIYFTNSSRYAADIYGQGHLLLSWVSMREPFPVVDGDIPSLAGQGSYKHYNAHFAPVSSKDPSNPYEPNYYPPKGNQAPHCDELVVFQGAQVLPRFWVELEICDLYLKKISAEPEYAEDLIPIILNLMANEEIDRDRRLRQILSLVLSDLLKQDPLDDLSDSQLAVYNTLREIFDSSRKIDRTAKTKLIEITKSLSSPSLSQDTPSYTLDRSKELSAPSVDRDVGQSNLVQRADLRLSDPAIPSKSVLTPTSSSKPVEETPVERRFTLEEVKKWNEDGERYLLCRDGTPQNIPEAVRLFTLAAHAGLKKAQDNLAFMYLKGTGVEKSFQEYKRWIQEADRKRKSDTELIPVESESRVTLQKGAALLNGSKETSTTITAFYQQYQKERSSTPPLAATPPTPQQLKEWNQQGEGYRDGKGVHQNSEEAARLFQLAAAGGFNEARFNLAQMYFKGEGTSKNEKEALRLWTEAADAGHAKSLRALGDVFNDGSCGKTRDLSVAFRYYKAAAMQNEPFALIMLGHYYEEGKAAAKDLLKAVEYYGKAFSAAQVYDKELAFRLTVVGFTLGHLYLTGERPIKKDLKKALFYFQRSADGGYAESQFRVGLMYFHGNGTKKDINMSYRYLKLAADQGHADAKRNLRAFKVK